jgi:putative endonuclease
MVDSFAAIAVYIMASGRNGTLYIGVTSELQSRIVKHKHGFFPGFTKQYGCTRLVWFERHGDMLVAIRREKKLKRYRRAWKLALIEDLNPDWRDLSEDWWGDVALAGSSGLRFAAPEDDGV